MGDTCVSDPAPKLTVAIADLDQIDFINPTIVTSGNWLKNRAYHKIVTDADNNAPEIAVYAPSDATAIGITHYLATMQPFVGPSFEVSQFDVRFDASCEVRYWFDHLSRLAEPFASLAAPEPSRVTHDVEVPISVPVDAGDVIGYTTGTFPAHVWDFILMNTSKINTFANQERYEGAGDLKHLLHADCPYDYYDEPLRSAYTSLFGNWQGRVADFGCDLEVDVLGTVAGGWFLSPYDPSDPFAFTDWGLVAKVAADGYVDVNGPGASIRTGPSQPSFADPKTLHGEHCFQHYNQPAQYAYLKLLSDMELAAAFGSGSCPSSLPSGVQTFYR